jgi:hypothetical protein
MVWPSANPEAPTNPRRGGAAPLDPAAAEPARKKPRKGTAGGRSTQGRRERSQVETGSSWLDRSTIETALLALALVVIGSFIAYWVWPPSAGYLYKQAEVLMASTNDRDWKTAQDEYLDPLDQRFPENPYREQTQKWRDRILLERAESRGRNLASGLDIPLTRPTTDGERKFVIANELATGAHKRGDDLTAIRQWQDFTQQVRPDDPDDRQWHLLGLHRAQQLENDIKDRRVYVEKQIEFANTAERAGRPNEALTIKSKLVEQFSQFTDLADIFPPAAPTADHPAPAAAEGAAEKLDPAKPAPPPHPTEPSPGAKPGDSLALTPIPLK